MPEVATADPVRERSSLAILRLRTTRFSPSCQPPTNNTKNHYIYYGGRLRAEQTTMTDRDGTTPSMYRHFTDAENTGAPLVPAVEDSAGEQGEFTEHEEAVLSHRIGT